MESQKSFILYHDMWNQLEKLSDKELATITRAIFNYHIKGEIIEMDRLCEIVFTPIQAMLDRDRDKWEEYIEKQSSNGKKGGRPKKSEGNPSKPKKPTAFSENPSKPKKADSVSVPVNVPVNDTYINSSKEEGQQAVEAIKKEYGNKEINDLLEIIKGQVQFLGLIYKKGKRERERAKNILTGKDFGEVCEKANMSRVEFCKQIIFMSTKLDFWNGKVNNAETLYEHYAKVYNEAVNKKQELYKQSLKLKVY